MYLYILIDIYICISIWYFNISIVLQNQNQPEREEIQHWLDRSAGKGFDRSTGSSFTFTCWNWREMDDLRVEKWIVRGFSMVFPHFSKLPNLVHLGISTSRSNSRPLRARRADESRWIAGASILPIPGDGAFFRWGPNIITTCLLNQKISIGRGDCSSRTLKIKKNKMEWWNGGCR